MNESFIIFDKGDAEHGALVCDSRDFLGARAKEFLDNTYGEMTCWRVSQGSAGEPEVISDWTEEALMDAAHMYDSPESMPKQALDLAQTLDWVETTRSGYMEWTS